MLKSITNRVHDTASVLLPDFYTGCVERLYSEGIKQANTGAFRYITVYFTVDQQGIHKEYSDSISYDMPFDFDHLESLSNNVSKKRFILDSLHNAAIFLCDMFGWDKMPFQDAYNNCLHHNLDYSWFFKKKLFLSPDKKHYFGLYHFVDLAEYEVHEVVFDYNKEEMARRICFRDTVPIFSIEKASWDGSNSFWYKFRGPAKIFKANIRDIINNEKYDLTTNSSNFFK